MRNIYNTTYNIILFLYSFMENTRNVSFLSRTPLFIIKGRLILEPWETYTKRGPLVNKRVSMDETNSKILVNRIS